MQAKRSRQRFIAPAREALASDWLERPIFSGLSAYRDLLVGNNWLSVSMLNARLAPLHHRTTGMLLSFVAQESVVNDLMHYESRIFQRGEIATRTDNWHDLFNALIWKTYPAIKSALNVRQVEDIASIGLQQRTRAQYAMTQFDEAGAIVVLRDPELLQFWDAHDWTELFFNQQQAWRDGRISLSLFGHALLEHALVPEILLVAKALVFFDDSGSTEVNTIDERVAQAITTSSCLRDPQELRPLPVSGILGWSHEKQDAAFYRGTPCFRPLRARRSYPKLIPLCESCESFAQK